MAAIDRRVQVTIALLVGCCGCFLLTSGSTLTTIAGVVLVAQMLVTGRVSLRHTTAGWLLPLLGAVVFAQLVGNRMLRSQLLEAGFLAASISATAVVLGLFSQRRRLHLRRRQSKPGAPRPSAYLTAGVRKAVEWTIVQLGIAEVDTSISTHFVGCVLLSISVALTVPALLLRVLGNGELMERLASLQLGLASAGVLLSIVGVPVLRNRRSPRGRPSADPNGGQPAILQNHAPSER